MDNSSYPYDSIPKSDQAAQASSEPRLKRRLRNIGQSFCGKPDRKRKSLSVWCVPELNTGLNR
jgi:hypothetical protein